MKDKFNYRCATMWHETPDEIKVCLKSVFKIDQDYYARRKALNLLPAKDTTGKSFKELDNNKKAFVDFFEWETHIFFDDCMAKPAEGQGNDEMPSVNNYVKDLIRTVEEYGKSWYGKYDMSIPTLTKYVTPYGGKKVTQYYRKKGFIFCYQDVWSGICLVEQV